MCETKYADLSLLRMLSPHCVNQDLFPLPTTFYNPCDVAHKTMTSRTGCILVTYTYVYFSPSHRPTIVGNT
jgi:hypothetical protein